MLSGKRNPVSVSYFISISVTKNENVRRWIQVSFLRTIEIINKIPLMMYRKILNYKHIFDIRRKEEGFDFLPDLIAISCVKEKQQCSFE